MRELFNKKVVVVLLILAAGATVYSQGRGRASLPGAYCADIPGLTEAQQEALKAEAVEHRGKMDVLRAERRGAADRSAWVEAGERMRALQQNHISTINSILTDEQRRAFTPRGAGNAGPVGVMDGRGRGRGIGGGAVFQGRGGRGPAATAVRGGGRGRR